MKRNTVFIAVLFILLFSPNVYAATYEIAAPELSFSIELPEPYRIVTQDSGDAFSKLHGGDSFQAEMVEDGTYLMAFATRYVGTVSLTEVLSVSMRETENTQKIDTLSALTTEEILSYEPEYYKSKDNPLPLPKTERDIIQSGELMYLLIVDYNDTGEEYTRFLAVTIVDGQEVAVTYATNRFDRTDPHKVFENTVSDQELAAFQEIVQTMQFSEGQRDRTIRIIAGISVLVVIIVAAIVVILKVRKKRKQII